MAGSLIYFYTSSIPWTVLPIIITLAFRITLHCLVQNKLSINSVYTPWLVPARDIFSLVVRIVSLLGRKVRWRNQTMYIHKGGRLSPLKKETENKTKKIGNKNEKDTTSQPTYV